MFSRIKSLPEPSCFLSSFRFSNIPFGFRILVTPSHLKLYVVCPLGVFSDYACRYSSLEDAASHFALIFTRKYL